jgi:hypothetical protein
MAAILEPAGAGGDGIPVLGLQVVGVVAQYQATALFDGKNPRSGLETITPYDSGNIIGHVQPGGSGQKLVDGTVQRGAQILASNFEPSGNALLSTASTVADPTPPTGSAAADGLSQAPQHE